LIPLSLGIPAAARGACRESIDHPRLRNRWLLNRSSSITAGGLLLAPSVSQLLLEWNNLFLFLFFFVLISPLMHFSFLAS